MKTFPLRAFLIGAAVFLAGCYTVPETGRSALSLVPESQVVAMADQQFFQLKQELPVSQNRAHNEQLTRVGERIAAVAEPYMPEGSEWEFVVFESDELNAFAMPGGKVGVYTGMMELVDSDDELAVVIGHEVAHVTSRHGSERMSQQLGVALGALAVGVAVEDDRELWLAAYGAGASLGVLLPYSRLHESEADQVGLTFMARAGYDPRAAIPFWQKMNEQGGSRPPEFLSTHPAPENRIERLRELMPKALEEYRKATGRD